MISFEGSQLDTFPEDEQSLLAFCTRFAQVACEDAIIYQPTERSRNAAYRCLLLVELCGRVIAMKRCRDKEPYLRREILVHHLRGVFGMNDYPVSRMEGVVMRSRLHEGSCKPFKGFSKPFVLIDFGRKGARCDLRDLPSESVAQSSRFFSQWGSAIAFDYIIGAQDRFRQNYVWEADTGKMYPVDNEERPLQLNAQTGKEEFVPFDSEFDNVRNCLRMFIPSDQDGRKTAVSALRTGFFNFWNQALGRLTPEQVSADRVLSAPESEIELNYARTIMQQEKPSDTLVRLLDEFTR